MLDVCISSMATNYHQISGIKKCVKKSDIDNFFGVRCKAVNYVVITVKVDRNLRNYVIT